MILTKVVKNFYHPSIKFPNRRSISNDFKMSPNKVKLTNRAALNAALDEEIERNPKVFLIGEEVAQYNGAYKISKGLF